MENLMLVPPLIWIGWSLSIIAQVLRAKEADDATD